MPTNSNMRTRDLTQLLIVSVATIALSSFPVQADQLGSAASAGPWATAAGPNAQADGTASVAVGTSANASGMRDIAIGDGATASGGSSIAHGYNTNSSGEYSLAIGNSAASSGTGSIALGSGANSSANHGAAVGDGAQASGISASAFGHYAGASGLNSIAVGYDAKASGAQGAAFGSSARASGAGSLALGSGANAEADNSVALGNGASATRGAQSDYSAAFLAAPQNSAGEVSVGSASGQRQITNVAAGSAATDAVNVAQLEAAVMPLSDGIGALTGRVDQLGIAVDEARSIAIAAGALSMAASQLRFDDRPGKVSLGVAGGHFHDKGAVAVGVGYTSPAQDWRANVSGSFAGGSETAVGGGVSFTLN